MESKKGIIIHSIVLGEGEEGVSFILLEDTRHNNTSLEKKWPQAWPVVPVQTKKARFSIFPPAVHTVISKSASLETCCQAEWIVLNFQ